MSCEGDGDEIMLSKSPAADSMSLPPVNDDDDDDDGNELLEQMKESFGARLPSSLTDNDKKQRDLNNLCVKFVLAGWSASETDWTEIAAKSFLKVAPNLKIPGARKIGRLVWAKSNVAMRQLIDCLRNVRRVAITADAWYDEDDIYIASTVHWFDEKTLERRNAYLGLTRLDVGSSHEALTRSLCEDHRQFGLEGKIAVMTVNSASNFQKVFDIFGEDPGSPIPSEGHEVNEGPFYGEVSDDASSSDEEDDEDPSGVEEDEERYVKNLFEADDEAVPVDKLIRKSPPVTDIPKDDVPVRAESKREKPFHPLPFPTNATPIDLVEVLAQHTDSALTFDLPKHFQCAARTLSLVATEDAAQALNEDGEHPQLFTSVAGKLKALWNLRMQLKKKLKSASSEVYGIGKVFWRLFLVEVKTRWDASYGAFKYIASLSDQEKKHLNEVLKVLGLSGLGAMEFAFISEYVEVLKPLVGILSLLLTDAVEPGKHKNFGMGYLVPSLGVILAKADQMLAEEGERTLKFCAPLLRAIKTGIMKRFEDVSKDEDFLVAAAVHPMFRLTRMSFLSTEEAERIISVVKERAGILRRKEKEKKLNKKEPPSKKLRADERLGLFDSSQPTSPSQLRAIEETAYDVDVDLFLKDGPQDDLSALGPLKKLYAEANIAMPACSMVARSFPHEEHMDEPHLVHICFLRANEHLFCRKLKLIL